MKIEIAIKEIEGEGYLCIKLADLTLLKRKRKTFTIPSIEEVNQYCKERKNNVNPVQWWNFYNAKNWMIGKTKMSNWQSAVVTWEKNEYSTIADKNGVIHRGTNLAPPPPEFFGVPSPTALTHDEYMANKKKL